jgi:hypothetical protein
MDTGTASELVMEALAHAVAGDADEATVALMTLGQQGDGNLMYGVCCALASAGEHGLRTLYGDRAPRPENGDMWVMQELAPCALAKDPPAAFAMRFVVAYANRDMPACLALYEAAFEASDEEYGDSIAALLADVAGILRLAREQRGT